MTVPEQFSDDPYTNILPHGEYTRYSGETSAGFLIRCISFDPGLSQQMLYLPKRGFYFSIALDTAKCEFVGDTLWDTDPTSPYVRAVRAIGEKEAVFGLAAGSYSKALEALLDGNIEIPNSTNMLRKNVATRLTNKPTIQFII